MTPPTIGDTVEAGREAAQAVERLGGATPVHFNQIISLVLLASVIALAGYEFVMGRPELIKEMKAGHDQGRQEFKAINDSNLDRFEKILDKQDKNHERVIEMVTGKSVRAAGDSSAPQVSTAGKN